MSEFLNSFTITPFQYQGVKQLKDTTLSFTVSSPVPLGKPKKLSLYPDKMPKSSDDDEDLTEENTRFNKLIADDSTGEKISLYVSQPGRYYSAKDVTNGLDSSYFQRGKMKWTFRNTKRYELPNKTKVFEYTVSDPKSSRYIRGKVFSRNGLSYWLQTEGDTISRP